MQKKHREEQSEERRTGKDYLAPGRAEILSGQDIADNAQAIGNEANNDCDEKEMGIPAGQGIADDKVDGTGGKTLDYRTLHRGYSIDQRGEVVIQSPEQTGHQDEKAAPYSCGSLLHR